MRSAWDTYTAARARIGLNFDDGLLDTSNPDGVLSVLNGALSELASDYDWPFLYAEVPLNLNQGQDVYPVPSGWLRTGFIVLKDSGNELVWRQRRAHFEFPSPGEPRAFDTLGDRLLIAPTPDQAYRAVHGYYEHFEHIERDDDGYPTLEAQLADTDLDVPAPFDHLLVLYVAKNIALLIKDRELYQMFQTEIADIKAKNDDNRRRQQSTGRIKTRRDY